MPVARYLLVLAHAGIGAVWLGSMAYSLFVVQPRVPRVLSDPAAAEEMYRELAAGNRWRVVALIGTVAASGAGLVAVAAGRTAGWWVLVAAKSVLLLVAAGLFWWVSWRAWPRRIFALPAELPALQRRFRLVALALTCCIGLAFALGVAAATVA
ncbi:MAG: hypothetical protein J2P15_20245 [Micromonosporaceae bacterium]|nr:hypothetical protein [Micromonosporaceae bacterium]